jgi:hypothetical protein
MEHIAGELEGLLMLIHFFDYCHSHGEMEIGLL